MCILLGRHPTKIDFFNAIFVWKDAQEIIFKNSIGYYVYIVLYNI